MKDYIMTEHGFREKYMQILMDDDEHTSPTKANILKAYRKLIKSAEPGDAVFCHFSGHGGQVKDKDGDEGKILFYVHQHDCAAPCSQSVTTYIRGWLRRDFDPARLQEKWTDHRRYPLRIACGRFQERRVRYLPY